MSTINVVNELSKQGAELVGEWAKNTCSMAKKAQKGCSSCDRNGDIVILPIRYSAAHKNTVRDFFLPPEEALRFTDIIPEDNSPACYIYRKLRKGFLYVYDSHPQLPIWQCYMVSERGELTEFSVNSRVTVDDIKNVKCTDSACSSWASLVSIRDSKTVRKIYFIYVEIPYSKKMLDSLAADVKKRENIMQSFCVSSIDSCKRAIGIEKIKDFVPEYNIKNDPFILLKDQLYPGRFYVQSDVQASDNFDNIYSFAVQKEDCSSRQSFAFIIDDNIGMIEQLNHLRYNPFVEFSANLLPGDEGDNSKFPGKSFNENNYKWYMAVNQLREVMRKMTPTRRLDVNPNFKADWKSEGAGSAKSMERHAHDMTYEQVVSKRKHIQELNSPKTNDKFNSLIEEKKAKGEDIHFVLLQKEVEAQSEVMVGPHAVEFNQWKRVEDFYKKQWMDTQFSESVDRFFVIRDFPSYYNEDAYYNIENTINKYKKKVDEDVPKFDNLYAEWVRKSILKAVEGFEEGNIIHGLKRTNVISSMLDYGILGEGSTKAWEWLENSKEGKVILLKAYSGGDRNISRTLSYIDNYDFDDEKINLEDVDGFFDKFPEKVKDFVEKVLEAHVGYKTNGLKSLFFETEIKDFFKSIKALKMVRNNARSALFIKDVGGAIRNKEAVFVDYRKANRSLAEHRLAEELERADPEFKNVNSGRIKYFSVEVDGRELKKISHKFKKMGLGENIDEFFDKAHEKFEFYNGNSSHSVGNYSATKYFDGPKMKLYIASTEEFYDSFMENFKKVEKEIGESRKSSVDILIKTCKEEQEKSLFKSKSFFQSAVSPLPTLLSLWILKGSINEYIEKGGWDNFWSMVSDSFTVMQDICLRIESQISRRALRAVGESVEVKASSILAARGWGIAGKIFSYGVAGIAIIQLLSDLQDAIEMQRKGEMDYVVQRKRVGAMLVCFSAIAIGVFAASIIGGIVGVLAEVAFLIFFNTQHYLPENIMYWLRRSKYGIDSDAAPGRRFENIEQEQNALNLIWKGVSFSQQVCTGKVLNYKRVEACSDGFCGGSDVPTVVEKKINYKIIVPKESQFLLCVERVFDNHDWTKQGFWCESDGKNRKFTPLLLRSTKHDYESTLKNNGFLDKIGSMARDEFGIKYTANGTVENDSNMKVSKLFSPEIKESGDYICINFSESVAIDANSEKSMSLKFSIIIDDEKLYDTYLTTLYHDDQRTV